MPEISAIITTYNRRALLRRAVNSVLQQSRPADEIIIVDDGSTDGTSTELQRLERRVKIINLQRRGISAARNAAISAARGEWLAFLDDDDCWLADKLARQLQAVAANPAMRLCHSEEIWIRNGRRVNAMRKHKKQGGWIYPSCLPLCVISPSAAMIHRSLFDEVGLFDERLPACEDYDLWLRVCARQAVLYIDEPLIIKYGGHKDQLSRRYWGMDRFRIRALEKMSAQPWLRRDYRLLTLQTLINKAEIYLQGARKRHKTDEIVAYERRLQQYRRQLSRAMQQVDTCC